MTQPPTSQAEYARRVREEIAGYRAKSSGRPPLERRPWRIWLRAGMALMIGSAAAAMIVQIVTAFPEQRLLTAGWKRVVNVAIPLGLGIGAATLIPGMAGAIRSSLRNVRRYGRFCRGQCLRCGADIGDCTDACSQCGEPSYLVGDDRRAQIVTEYTKFVSDGIAWYARRPSARIEAIPVDVPRLRRSCIRAAVFLVAGASFLWPGYPTIDFPDSLIATGFCLLFGGVWILSAVAAKRGQIRLRRYRLGLCLKCGHDLRACRYRCSECGEPVYRPTGETPVPQEGGPP